MSDETETVRSGEVAIRCDIDWPRVSINAAFMEIADAIEQYSAPLVVPPVVVDPE